VRNYNNLHYMAGAATITSVALALKLRKTRNEP